MTSNEIRQSFLEFFKGKSHHIVSSAPVVPQDDPTLLFTNAGMNQFKDIFIGIRQAQYDRIADSQKCIRVSGKHNDLEEVGRDTYHHTFFEMLGNWSFGDYFKAEAIQWAWELLTNVWKLPKDKLYATVFAGDETDNVDPDIEAEEEWKKLTDIDHSHILRFGKKDNFWEMGDTGPCGPCSEIHIDRGPEFCDNSDPDHVCAVNSGCARYIELWNLVFIQYNRDQSGKLHVLPAKHVDTGAGFERLVSVIQDTKSNYDTDIFTPILNAISELTGKKNTGGETNVAFCVLADHIRALSFAIADGAIPSHEGRGYVLRRILRRAARFGRVLDMREPFFYKLVSPLVEVMGDAYPEIKQRQEYISRVIRAEEESFGRTLDRGIEIFEQKAKAILSNGHNIFPGKDAFLLHDTYGFPLDLTQLMAEEKGLSVDVPGFTREMDLQRERSGKDTKAVYETINITAKEKSEFVGYEQDETETEIIHAEKIRLILKQTPFYAESGGQVGDTGKISNDNFSFNVTNTRYVGEHIVHFGELITGDLPQAGDPVIAKINIKNRRATERNHTVTHLLHKALRTVLGDHVHQAGSLVHPDYMRFDFTHFEKISEQDLKKIEDIVNQNILENRETTWQVLPIDKAKKLGAMALFGEKYGENVRMVEIENYSRELCGGTHVSATGEIGEFVITGESAIAAGTRRIESITGLKSLEHFRAQKKILEQSSELLACPPEETIARLKVLLDERKALEQELKKYRDKSSKKQVETLLNNLKTIDGIKWVAGEIHAKNVDELRASGDKLRNAIGSGIGVLGAVINEKVNFVCVVTKDVIESKKIKAGDIVKEVAAIAGGSGGGSPHMAVAGAKDLSKLGFALSETGKIIRRKLN